MGYPTERAGWYTPHWLDELMWGERPRSAETIRSDLQGLKVGDTVPDRPDWAAKYVVEEVAPPSHPVLHSTWHVWGPIRSSDFSWVFALQPVEETLPTGEATRLVVRARVVYEPKWIYPFGETVIGLGDWLNVSVMLRGDQEARGADGLLA